MIEPVWLLPAITFDAVIVGLTIVKSYRLNESLKAVGMQSKFALLFIHHGARYYLLNVASTDFAYLRKFISRVSNMDTSVFGRVLNMIVD